MEPPPSDANQVPPAAPAPNASAGPDAPTPTSTRGHACYDIPPLENDGGNFGSWKIRAEAVLDVRDLWLVVDGTFPRPNHTASHVEHVEWSSKNQEARTLIILALKDEPLDTIVDAETAAECWEKLLQRYEGKGVQRKMQHLDEIFKMTFTDSDPLEPSVATTSLRVFEKNVIINSIKYIKL